jgi:hypothetical protein
MQAGRDYIFIQTGGELETIAALASGTIDAATLTVLSVEKATSMGFRAAVYGPDLHVPSVAARSDVLRQFMRAMAEAMKIVHTDKELAYRILGKRLRITDRKVLETAYRANIRSFGGCSGDSRRDSGQKSAGPGLDRPAVPGRA